MPAHRSRLAKQTEEEHELKKAELQKLSFTQDEELEKLREEHEQAREDEERQLR